MYVCMHACVNACVCLCVGECVYVCVFNTIASFVPPLCSKRAARPVRTRWCPNAQKEFEEKRLAPLPDDVCVWVVRVGVVRVSGVRVSRVRMSGEVRWMVRVGDEGVIAR